MQELFQKKMIFFILLMHRLSHKDLLVLYKTEVKLREVNCMLTVTASVNLMKLSKRICL